MLPRAAIALRRASTNPSFIVKPNLILRRAPQQSRQLSLWPFRRNKVPHDVPVYFPRPAGAPKPGTFRKRLGYDSALKLNMVYSCANLQSFSRIVFTTVTLYVCWQIFATVVFDPLLDWADHEWDNLSEKEKREMEEMSEEEADPLLFLPFPFTTKEVKQPPYKGSDPEWLAFLAVNKDTQAQKDIKCTWTAHAY